MADASYDPKNQLTPDDWNYFRSQKRRVNDTYGLNLSQNTYQRQTAQNAYGRNRRNLATQWDRMRENLAAPYAGRGMLNSGIYQQAVGRYAEDRSRAFADLEGSHQDALGGFRLAEQQLESVRAGALQDLEEQEAARRATIAAALRQAGLGI